MSTTNTVDQDVQEVEENANNSLSVAEESAMVDVNNGLAIADAAKNVNLNYIELPDGLDNVIHRYKWTVIDDPYIKNTYLYTVPKISMTEYQPTGNQFIDTYVANLKTLFATISQKTKTTISEKHPELMDKFTEYSESYKVANVDPSDVYQKIYNGTPTGNHYTFPFISKYHTEVINNWGSGDSSSDADSVFGSIIANAGSIFGAGGANGFGGGVGAVDTMKVWSPNGPATYTFTFELHNTMVDSIERVDNFVRNYNLIRALKYNNLPERLTSNVLMQPAFYSVSIPGVHYSPASVISKLSVESLGQKDLITLPVNMYRNAKGLLTQSTASDASANIQVEVPDAYSVTITVSDLYTETKNLYEGSFSQDKISVIA